MSEVHLWELGFRDQGVVITVQDSSQTFMVWVAGCWMYNLWMSIFTCKKPLPPRTLP